MDLDHLLDSSAPPIARRTADLERELHRLVLDAESAARPRRRSLRIGLAGALATVVIGAGTAGGMAVGLVPAPHWVPWTTPAGSQCSIEFTVSPVVDLPPGDGDARSRGHSAAEKQAAVAEANRFLKSFDYSSIDQAAAIREFQKAEDAAIAGQPDPAERQPRTTGDDLVLSAVGVEIWERLAADLTAKKLEPYALNYSTAYRCGG
ncbi:hypothetical protein Kfla_6615 [Kribbella flavida DSM 17836]|uniref:Uncharacterized protein n=2 Tax=Kribbella flavida TaxID=182640 RepID=D2PZP1_KRIFD|nr:hypothetical protein Kfla_6615 [Kribbella flavida DSM 17836]